MNPFGTTSNATGRRGFDTAAKAKASALAQPETQTFAILEHRSEFAWVAPTDVVHARLANMMFAGISVVEFGQK